MRFVAVVFASCSSIVACGARTELPTPPPVCGNGIVEEGEECDLGADNSDAVQSAATSTFTVSQPGAASFEVSPLVRARSAVSFYDYVGASSFTGLEAFAESRLYLYVDSNSDRLSLIVNHNVFEQGDGDASMHFTGLPKGFAIDLSDDAGELKSKPGSTTADGNWEWTKNTDGGVLGNLCGGWSIVATATFTKGISTWVWVDADGSRHSLAMNEPVTIQAATARCRTDCTMPKCN